MPLDDPMRFMSARDRSVRSAAALPVHGFALRGWKAGDVARDRRRWIRMRGQALRAGQAVAHGAASFLGLGGMPWLATYVIGRDLIDRLTNARPSIKR